MRVCTCLCMRVVLYDTPKGQQLVWLYCVCHWELVHEYHTIRRLLLSHNSFSLVNALSAGTRALAPASPMSWSGSLKQNKGCVCGCMRACACVGPCPLWCAIEDARVCVCMCGCICMCICVYACMYVCMYVCPYAYVCVYAHVYVCMYMPKPNP